MRDFVLAVLFLLFVMASCFYAAFAHDGAQWIEDGNYKGNDNTKCCGPNDCEPIANDRIEVHKDGFYLMDFKELVPFVEATPSEDKSSWRCRIRGSTERRCFFFRYGSS